jgi:hypothetical protein
MTKEGDLQVWHIPQVPGKAFTVDVENIREAKRIDKILCDYDMFELNQRVKGDFCNAGGLNIYEDGEWVSWHNKDGDDFDEIDMNGDYIGD